MAFIWLEINRSLLCTVTLFEKVDFHKIPYAIWLIISSHPRNSKHKGRVNLYAGYACKYEA